MESQSLTVPRTNITLTDDHTVQTERNEAYAWVNANNLTKSGSSDISSDPVSSNSVDGHHWVVCGPTSSSVPATASTFISINDDTSIRSSEIESQTVDDIYYRKMQGEFDDADHAYQLETNQLIAALKPGESIKRENRSLRPYLQPDESVPMNTIIRPELSFPELTSPQMDWKNKYRALFEEGLSPPYDTPFADMIHDACHPQLIEFGYGGGQIQLDLVAGTNIDDLWSTLLRRLNQFGIDDPRMSDFQFNVLPHSEHTKKRKFSYDSSANRFCCNANELKSTVSVESASCTSSTVAASALRIPEHGFCAHITGWCRELNPKEEWFGILNSHTLMPEPHLKDFLVILGHFFKKKRSNILTCKNETLQQLVTQALKWKLAKFAVYLQDIIDGRVQREKRKRDEETEIWNEIEEEKKEEEDKKVRKKHKQN